MSALRPSDLEEFTKRRRLVQDVDLDFYLAQKAQLLAFIDDLRLSKIERGSEEFNKTITELKWKLEMANKRVLASAEWEEHKHEQLTKKLKTFESDSNELLREMILKSTDEYNILLKRLDATTDLLKKRERINTIIQNYLNETKIIKMTRVELQILFKDHVTDLNPILSSGRIVLENKQDHEQDVFEFKFEKSTLFQKGTDELKQSIEQKLRECEIVKEKVESNKAKWIELSSGISSILTSLTESVH